MLQQSMCRAPDKLTRYEEDFAHLVWPSMYSRGKFFIVLLPTCGIYRSCLLLKILMKPLLQCLLICMHVHIHVMKVLIKTFFRMFKECKKQSAFVFLSNALVFLNLSCACTLYFNFYQFICLFIYLFMKLINISFFTFWKFLE